MTQTLKDRIFKGILWNSLARVIQQIFQFGSSVILARLLLPEDFGMIGMLLVFTGFVSLFADAGLSSAIVQKADLEERHITSVFWVNLLIGVGLTIIGYFSAPLLAQFYRLPLLEPLTKVISINFFIAAFGVVPRALMEKRMQFEKLTQITLVATVISGTAGIVLAILGFGVWSLVAQSLSAALITSILSWIIGDWTLQPTINKDALKELWAYSANLFGFNFLNYFARNADSILIGRFLGASVLGLYSRAYGLMLLPITQIISIISNVMFSALSSIQDDKERVKKIYLRAISMIALVSFPLMLGLLVTAEPFIITVYGERWADVIPVLRVLAGVGLLQAIISPAGWIYTSQGRTDLMLWFGVGWATAMISAIMIGVWLGTAQWVAICYALANLLLFYPAVSIPGKLINISFGDIIGAISGVLISSFMMGFLVMGIGLLIPPTWREWQELIVLVLIGGISYGGIVFLLRIAVAREAYLLIKEKIEGQLAH